MGGDTGRSRTKVHSLMPPPTRSTRRDKERDPSARSAPPLLPQLGRRGPGPHPLEPRAMAEPCRVTAAATSPGLSGSQDRRCSSVLPPNHRPGILLPPNRVIDNISMVQFKKKRPRRPLFPGEATLARTGRRETGGGGQGTWSGRGVMDRSWRACTSHSAPFCSALGPDSLLFLCHDR